MRQHALFPRYLFIPINQAYAPAIRLVPSINRHKPVLSSNDGRIWVAPGPIIDAVREAEERGDYDEILKKGNRVTFAAGVLACIQSLLPDGRVELLTPLFGNCRATTRSDKVALAS
jgi:hypothetical protein